MFYAFIYEHLTDSTRGADHRIAGFVVAFKSAKTRGLFLNHNAVGAYPGAEPMYAVARTPDQLMAMGHEDALIEE